MDGRKEGRKEGEGRMESEGRILNTFKILFHTSLSIAASCCTYLYLYL